MKILSLALLLFATSLFATPAFAQEGSAFGNFGVFFPLVILIAIFYFFIIRPQNKRLKTHRDMVAGLRRGDTVITSGGIVGKIHRVIDDNECLIEIADNVRVKVVKTTISSKQGDDAPPSANGTAQPK